MPLSILARWQSASSQAPQSAHCQDDGEERGHADREECPDEEEASVGSVDPTPDADAFPFHMDIGDKTPKQRPEEYDHISRSPFVEQQGCVEPNDTDGNSSEVRQPSLFKPAHYIVREVKRKEEERDQRRSR